MKSTAKIGQGNSICSQLKTRAVCHGGGVARTPAWQRNKQTRRSEERSGSGEFPELLVGNNDINVVLSANWKLLLHVRCARKENLR